MLSSIKYAWKSYNDCKDEFQRVFFLKKTPSGQDWVTLPRECGPNSGHPSNRKHQTAVMFEPFHAQFGTNDAERRKPLACYD